MKLILDTHSFLWWCDDPTRLAEDARLRIEDHDNNVLISSVVFWEVAIKMSVRKLTASLDDLANSVDKSEFSHLPITFTHAMAISTLPMHHRDPFDRLLIAQAMAEDATVVSRDPIMTQYSVPVIKA